MTDTAPSAKTPASAIYALNIERFRGITTLRWKPSRGVNVILGGGDVGKTTILEAIALLLSPVNPTTLSDPDYHDRHIEAGFSIEAVLSLPAGAGISSQMKPSCLGNGAVKKRLFLPWNTTASPPASPSIVFGCVAPKTSNSLMRSYSPTVPPTAFLSHYDARSASSASAGMIEMTAISGWSKVRRLIGCSPTRACAPAWPANWQKTTSKTS
jgi:AAA domain